MIRIWAGEWDAELRPEIGGSLSALRHRGVDVLRPMPDRGDSPLQAACFPLAPWCNRIREGRFAFAGRSLSLPANFPPEPHSLHGLAWQRTWTVEDGGGGTFRLVDEYDGGGAWPWAYWARQQIRLDARGCTVTLTVTNLSGEPMPAGLGLHPYFRRRADTQVQFAADRVLLSGADPLPTGESAPAGEFALFAAGARLPTSTVDHCFAGWSGSAVVHDDLGTITITAEGAPHLHLYAPADGSVLCLEPVSHTPDAPNRAPEEMTVLPPGCSASVTMLIGAASG